MAFHFITICMSYYFLCLSFLNNSFALILDLSTGSHGAHRHLILLETNGAKEVNYLGLCKSITKTLLVSRMTGYYLFIHPIDNISLR